MPLTGWRNAMRSRPVLASVLVVGLVASLVRLALLVQSPLVVTNDGVLYTHWAWAIAHGQWPPVPSYRTPGYPLLVAGIFDAVGRDPLAVHAVQRVLGVLAAGVVAGVAASLVKRGRRPGLALPVGLLCGLIPALDPRPLALEGFLLSETLGVFLAVVLLVLPMGLGRFRTWHVVWIAFAAGLLCLTRPAFQVAVPLVLLAVVLVPGPARPRVRAAALLAGVGVFLATIGPWLVYNHRRGVGGLGEGGGAVLWLGLAMAGRLDTSLAPTPELAAEYDRIVGDNPHPGTLHEYVFSIGTFERDDVRAHISNWAMRSVREHPGDYAIGVLHAALWQSDYLPRWSKPPDHETRWFVRRVAVDARHRGPGSNFNIEGEPDPLVRALSMDRPSRGVAWIFNAWASQRHHGAWTLLLLVIAVGAGVVSLVRRRWSLALLFAGSGVVFALHAALVSPYGRYSMPVWMAWSVAPAVLAMGGREPRSPQENG